VPVLAGRLLAGAELVEVAGVELELELLQPAASTAAATAAKPARPSLLCLRTVVPPGGKSSRHHR
jgi:hypothetical protein